MKKIMQKGETLVEALIALGVATAIATGIVTAIVTSLSATDFNQDSNFALNLAQEGADIVKDKASASYSTFTSTYTTNYYCLGEDNELDSNTANCPDNDTNLQVKTSQRGSGNYLRKVYLNQSGCDARAGACSGANIKCSGSVFLASIVAWSDSRCSSNNNCHDVEIDSCIPNLNQLPAP